MLSITACGVSVCVCVCVSVCVRVCVNTKIAKDCRIADGKRDDSLAGLRFWHRNLYTNKGTRVSVRAYSVLYSPRYHSSVWKRARAEQKADACELVRRGVVWCITRSTICLMGLTVRRANDEGATADHVLPSLTLFVSLITASENATGNTHQYNACSRQSHATKMKHAPVFAQ